MVPPRLKMVRGAPTTVLLRISSPLDMAKKITRTRKLRTESARTLCRPKEWNGDLAVTDDFAMEFQQFAVPVEWTEPGEKHEMLSKGEAVALCSMVCGGALSFARCHHERQNGCGIWLPHSLGEGQTRPREEWS